MGLLKLLGLSTGHEGQHAGTNRGQHAAKPGKHTKVPKPIRQVKK